MLGEIQRVMKIQQQVCLCMYTHTYVYTCTQSGLYLNLK